jgi:alkylation response protein AidB-like acyl-CoA dehydrogenase
MQASGLIPNYEASMGKMYSSEVMQRVARTGATAIGLYANIWQTDPRAPLHGEWADAYVRCIPTTIRGGSSEVQRNVIAGRGLGLPRG